jgi:single-strand DNA-binding protein
MNEREERAAKMNKIMLIGNLGKDPIMSYTGAGRAYTKFTLAVNRRWKDRQSGERREETTWFNVTGWDQLAEIMNTYLHKGSKVYIEGRMTSHSAPGQDGVERTYWDVTASEMEMLDTKGQQGEGPLAAAVGPDDVPF